MTKNILILLFNAFFALVVFGQENTFKVSGKVINAETKLPLSNVNVQLVGTLRATITDTNGLFELSYKEKNVAVSFSMLGYERQFVKIKEHTNNQLTVSLLPKTETIKEVIISPSPAETVIKSKNSNVLDYSFYNDNILLIMFWNNLSKSKLILISPAFDTLSKIDVPEKPTGLFKDCLGNNNLICENNIYQIYFDSANLRLHPPQKIEKFEAILFPCVAQDSTNLFFVKKYGAHIVDLDEYRRIHTNNHILNYYYVNKYNKKKNNLDFIADIKTLKQSDEETEYENMKEANGFYDRGPSKDDDRIFAETILYKEVYAPLYIIHDTIYVFDYINSKIKCYSSSGRKTKELEIKFNNEKNWKPEMCFDEKKQKVYALFESYGGITELREINLNTGILYPSSTKIPFCFVDNIKVYDNYIYFLYQGKEYSDTKFLSRLKAN